MEDRREIVITEAENGTVFKTGRQGFSFDEIICCSDLAELYSNLARIHNIWNERKEYG